jgi:hypothetical protein
MKRAPQLPPPGTQFGCLTATAEIRRINTRTFIVCTYSAEP